MWTTYESAVQPGEPSLNSRPVFDLASLTKPLVTALSCLQLIREGQLSLHSTLADFFSCELEELVPDEGERAWKTAISIEQLLTHMSGYPAHREYFRLLNLKNPAVRQKMALELVLKEGLENRPGFVHTYSDLNFMLLGWIVEKCSGMSLNSYWLKKICEPLGLSEELFFPADGVKRERAYISTGFCPWSGGELKGVVHDDNCRSLGGIAGHAGLFGTVSGVLNLCREIHKGYFDVRQGGAAGPCSTADEVISKSVLSQVLSGSFGGRHLFGFDTPSPQGSSCGNLFSEQSIGHLGFTGTSFWIDLKKGRGVVICTNRVYCNTPVEYMRKFRPALHDMIIGCIADEELGVYG